MWRDLAAGVGVFLVAVTPGAALAALQAWAPVVVLAATMLGGAVATAVVAYQKAISNTQRIATLERHIPKRSTDTPIGKGTNGVPATPLETTLSRGAASPPADMHQGGEP